MTVNAFKHREVWLHAGHRAASTDLRLSRRNHPGQHPAYLRLPERSCLRHTTTRWGMLVGANSADGHFEIMVSPVLADPMRVAGVLAHELVHATVGTECGHKSPFAKLARAIRTKGKMTAATEGDAFEQAVAPILDTVGPYPHAELSKSARTKGDAASQIAMSNLPLHGADHSEIA
jgi:hypothetical protein